MFRNRLLQIAQLSAVGLTGFYIGQNKDKFSNYNNEDSIVIDGKRLRSMPGLPVFGTVSAATPYTDSGSSKDRVRFVTMCSHNLRVFKCCNKLHD